MSPKVLLPLLGLLGAACWNYRVEWENALASRASFELQCPPKDVRIHALTSETFGNTDAPLYQGVEGCGKRTVYVATISGYVLNSGQGDATALTQPPPTPPPPPPPPPPAPIHH